MIQRCTKGDEPAYRWGAHGEPFTGKYARVRAEAVGRALKAQAEVDRDWDELSQARVEARVAQMNPSELVMAMGLSDQASDSIAPPVVSVGVTELTDTVRKIEFDAEVKKFSDEGELQCVWAEVYVPNLPDAHGDYMTADEIRKMAHRFLAQQKTQSVDVQHDEDPSRALEIVESYICDVPEHPDGFIQGSWVVCCHVEDQGVWAKIKAGELNGFSMQARVHLQEDFLEFEVPEEGVTGTTEEAGEGGVGLHRHGFTVTFDANGKFLGGRTTVAQSHFHEITSGTLTESSTPQGQSQAIRGSHQHRFSFLEFLVGGPLDTVSSEAANAG
jgi:hypothetical protein